MEYKPVFTFNLPLENTMQFEESHPSNAQLTLAEKQELRHNGTEFIYLTDEITGDIIGETYYIKVDNMDKLSANLRVPSIEEWIGKNAVYCYSNTILVKYQKRGFGRILKDYFLKHVESKGFEISIGHARSAGSSELNESFGAKRIHACPNWAGTGETYYFYVQTLKDLTRVILKARIQPVYEQIKSAMCSMYQVQYSSADIKVELVGSDSRYNPDTEEFIISLPNDFETSDFQDGEHIWQSWKSDLVHEMAHEYQFKITPDISENGRALYSLFQLSSEAKRPGQMDGFDGKGHDELFYTCVDLFARYFGMSGRELVTGHRKHI